LGGSTGRLDARERRLLPPLSADCCLPAAAFPTAASLLRRH